MDKTQKFDPNKTMVSGAVDNRTQAMSAPPVAGDPNRTTAWAPADPVTVTVTPTEVVWLPAASRARAATTCVPLGTVDVVQLTVYGEAVSSAPSDAPSTRNCTPVTPTLSDAEACTVTEPDTVDPLEGEVIAALGAVVSGGGGGGAVVVPTARDAFTRPQPKIPSKPAAPLSSAVCFRRLCT